MQFFLCRNTKGHDFARTSHHCCNSRNPVAFGDCHSAFHQSPTPSESEPVCGASASSTGGPFQGLALQESVSRFRHSLGGIQSTQKINDMSYDQLISDLSNYVKKRTQRQDDSILLRHMDLQRAKSVTGYHCNVQGVMLCNRSLKLTAISLSSCEAELYAASACADELLGLAELFKELHYKVSVCLEMDSDSAHQVLQRGRPGGLKHIETRCLAIQQCIREKRLSAGRVDTKSNAADLFTIFVGGITNAVAIQKT